MDKNKGLYKKYTVERTDGSSATGGKHEHCQYFVIDMTHDKFAKPALKAYAEACAKEYPQLSKELLDIVNQPAAPEVFKFTFKCVACGEIWKQADTDKPVLCPRGCGSMEREGA